MRLERGEHSVFPPHVVRGLCFFAERRPSQYHFRIANGNKIGEIRKPAWELLDGNVTREPGYGSQEKISDLCRIELFTGTNG